MPFGPRCTFGYNVPKTVAPEDSKSMMCFESTTASMYFCSYHHSPRSGKKIIFLSLAFGKSLWPAGTVGKHLSVWVHSRPLDPSPACMLGKLFACLRVCLCLCWHLRLFCRSPFSLSLCSSMIYEDQRLLERMCAFASL